MTELKDRLELLLVEYNSNKINLCEVYHKVLQLQEIYNKNYIESELSKIATPQLMFLLITYQNSQTLS